LTVKDGDATILINGQEFKVPKDHNLTIKPGTMVCFVSGSGTAVIDKKIKLNSKNKNCYQVPLENDTDLETLLSSIKEEAIIDVEKESTPSSSRGIEALKVVKGTISLPPSKKEVVIYGKDYGPLPVTLSIKKPDGTGVKEIVNEERTTPLFRIPANYLENDSKIEMTNAFGDKLLDKKVSSVPNQAAEEHGQVFYEKKKHTIVDILYGTDRKINQKRSSLEKYYSGERGKLQYGVAQVSIPKEHKLGAMERPGFWQSEKIGKHVMITKLEKIDGEKFVSFLKSKLSHVKEKDILIFIHGFNVTFANAIRRTAQISYDLKFKGVPMAYSWPSQGEVSEYMHDESSVQYTVPHLVSFLKKVIDNKGDAHIHIIGHSMGTRALTNALKEISYIYSGEHVFKNIILAAPDIDKDVFKESLYPYIIKTTDQITLYASSDDSALKLSMTLHGGERIGQGGDNIFVFKGLDTIDATGIDTSLLGHSYFAEKEVLVKDIKDVIQKSLPPAKRKSLIEKIKAKLIYWKFIFENR
jgi:esterase/lipase superfamily enzyme